MCKTDEFSSVFAFRRSLRSTHFQLSYRPSSRCSARLGLVVARKFAPLAVRRNLVKRLAREAFRMKRVDLPPFDLVLRLSARLGDADRRVLRAEIDDLLLRLPA
ncbi:MAG TPA: ribonuclease P protein component [Rhodocyclaceae bacterium]|nr:ribonuclease P protein component [Rhodocyclaceae bacterium]HMZ84210.1 ribonuclease P protein component [Rhodocyclaceae bacterium]HNA04121.1 ribonuclease P protein component [Rhodocyclaceae bacterium]HNB79708.1 ribonuclease P protein component [Rhodocyclaceae bacterium]HNC61311.1 ribonuclease P protein component [Rhodocyclaceae bacterium]